jgi:hypothetical protein
MSLWYHGGNIAAHFFHWYQKEGYFIIFNRFMAATWR